MAIDKNKIGRASYFFSNAKDEADAIYHYLHGLSDDFITDEDVSAVLERIDDELSHIIGDIADGVERLGIYPTPDDLAENIARILIGVPNNTEVFKQIGAKLGFTLRETDGQIADNEAVTGGIVG
jgi:hypothetical protein